MAGRLERALTSLGASCPRPSGAFYLYPDFGPWRRALAERNVRGSAELARHLLEEHGVASLPGIAFGDAPAALRLRLAVSGLCADAEAPADRKAKLEGLLEQADALPPQDPASAAPLGLPVLERAEARFATFVRGLGAREPSVDSGSAR